MTLHSLSLTHFRSHEKATFPFSSATWLIGPNGAGKTNVLEALYLLATGKVLRGLYDGEVVRMSESVTRVVGTVDSTELSIGVERPDGDKNISRKRFYVDGAARTRASFLGRFRAVGFFPQDLDVVTGSPAQRRSFFDHALVQLNPAFAGTLREFEHIVRNRNKVLASIREGVGKEAHLDFWDERLISLSGIVQHTRGSFIDRIQNVLSEYAPTRAAEGYTLLYTPSVVEPTALPSNRAREVAAKHTLRGAHRDDVLMTLRGMDLSRFGSRGEQRYLLVLLTLVLLDVFERERGERPVLLLDDVFSEFDAAHQELIVSLIEKQQTVIAATALPEGWAGSGEVIRFG